MPNAAQYLKGLQTRQSKLKAELQQIKIEEKDILQRKKAIEKQLKEINHEIHSTTKKKPVVTEHAVLQYLARSGKVNLEEIQKEIMGKRLFETIKTIKNGKIPLTPELTAVVKDYTVVTVVPAK